MFHFELPVHLQGGLPQPVGGDQSFAAAVTYSVAPSASFPRGELRYLDDALSSWDTSSADALLGSAYEQTEGSLFTGWSQSAGADVAITIDLGEARSANEMVAQGYYGTSSIFRPTEAHLESSDNGVAWTNVESFTGLSAGSGTGGAGSWLIQWDTSAAGSHRYWRITFEHGGTWLFLGRIRFGTEHTTLGQNVTASLAPSGSFPFNLNTDRLRSGDSNYTDDAYNQLSYGARALLTESFTAVMFAGWNQSAGATVTLTLDQGAANPADRLALKGYHGSDSIFRPTAVVIEYSDNGSSWTTHESKTALTGGGSGGAAYWLVVSDISGQTHRYWRATLTHGGTWLFVSTFELWETWINQAIGRPYTISTAADANFPNDRPTQLLGVGDTDWVTGAGKLTNGERGLPSTIGSGVGWSLGSGASASARIDLGSAMEGDHFVIHGIHGSGGSMVTPVAVVTAYSDDDTNWTNVLNKSGLAAANNAKGRWVVRSDIAAAGSHRYWRVTVTQTASAGLFIALTQLEFWQEATAAVQVAVGQATEVEVANPITPFISREVVVGQATEVEAAQPITPSISRVVTVGTATEVESAQPITPLVHREVEVGPAIESEIANPITPSISRVVIFGQVVEVETANPITPVKPIFVNVGTAVERELAAIITPVRSAQGQLGSATCSVVAPSATCTTVAGAATCRVDLS